MLWTVTVILWWFWLIFTNLIPGWSILLIFYRDLKNKFNILEIFAYSFCFGTAYLTILGFILDWTIGINLINIIIPTCAIILAALIFRRKYVIKQLRFQFTAERYKGLILIFLVLAFGLVIRVGVPLANEILMAWDPWHWLNISKNIVYQGHSLIGFKPLYPSGYAYITGISCLFDLELTYLFIQLISVGLYFIIGCITVICLSNKILKNNKIYSLFGGLIFSSSYFLASYGMLGLPQNVAFALIPAGLFFASQSGLTRIQGFFLIVGVYIIHSPSAMLIIINLFIYGVYYIVTNREAIHYKETKIIIIFLSLLALTIIVVMVGFLPFVVEYFIKFTYASSIKPEPIHYLFYSAGIITYTLTLLGGLYSIKNGERLLNLFFILFIVALIFSLLPAGFLGIPWPPVRYIMYMSISSSIVASFGIQEAVKLIKKYDKYNISKYTIPFFIIGTIILQSSIGLTALVDKGYWDFAISRDEYQVLIWVNSQSAYSEHIMVYPSIILPSRAFLNPRSVGTNATHIFNETIVNNTILSELLATEFNYIMVNTSSYPVLTSLLEADPAFTLVYLVSNIRLYRF